MAPVGSGDEEGRKGELALPGGEERAGGWEWVGFLRVDRHGAAWCLRRAPVVGRLSSLNYLRGE